MIELTLSIVLQLIQTAGILVGIIYYLTIMNNARKTSKTQIVNTLREQVQSRERLQFAMNLLDMKWDSFEDFREKYDSTVNPDNYVRRVALWGFHDAVGYMLSQGIVDIETVYNMLGSHQTLLTWNKFKDIIREQRVFYNNPHWFRWFEYLAVEMSKERVRQGLLPDIIDSDGYTT